MTEFTSNDLLSDPETPATGLPKTLNVLTILTFIGCAVFGIFTLLTPVITRFMLKIMDRAANSGQEMSAKKLEDMQRSREMMELTQANMVPYVAVLMVGILLCLAGAIMMRKLKKDGFWIYVAGQVVPIVGSLVIIGTKYNTMWSYLFYLVPALFIFLYAQQRKFMVR